MTQPEGSSSPGSTPPSGNSAHALNIAATSGRKQSSPGIDEIRQLFLAVKHSEKDVENVDKRIKNSCIRNIETTSTKIREEEVPIDEFVKKLDTFIRDELITEQNKKTVLAMKDNERTLEEAHARHDRFGYLAAVNLSDKIDYVLIVIEAEYTTKPTLCGCFMPSRQKQIKRDYLNAIVINHMRNKVFEELRIEGLTTRGQHHRKERFRSKSTTSATAEGLPSAP